MSLRRLVIPAVTLLVICICTSAESDEREKENDDGYGTEWLYFVSDNGSTHVMNFSTIPGEARGMFFGNTHFHLYTRNNPDNPETLNVPENDSRMTSTYFNCSNKVKMVTHGWMSSDNTEWLQNIKDAYLTYFDYNVITVDWSEIASNPSYVWPALSTRYVGKRVAQMLQSLKQSYRVYSKDVHLIGHSLGAQVMGYAGMFTNGKIIRITGLDPARPLFEFPYMPSNFRLEASDAEFVDIIHTCGGVLGYRKSHGDADFYPNNGKAQQPGCEGMRAAAEGCSHGRSCQFYAESIESEPPFTAYPCESWKSYQNGECRANSTSMGDPVSLDCRGDYYLRTRNESKYAKNDD